MRVCAILLPIAAVQLKVTCPVVTVADKFVGNATFGVDALRICGKLKNDDIAGTRLSPDRVDQFVHQEAIVGP